MGLLESLGELWRRGNYWELLQIDDCIVFVLELHLVDVLHVIITLTINGYDSLFPGNTQLSIQVSKSLCFCVFTFPHGH